MIIIRKKAFLLIVVITIFCASMILQPERLSEMTMAEPISVPAIMYHSINPNENKSSKFVITPDLLRSDLEHLKEQGYTTVFPAELYNTMLKGDPLPNKPILITFDDGHLNFLTYAFPILEELEMKAVVSVVGSYCDNAVEENDPNPAYAYLTWEDVRTLSQSPWISIANHSYDMHNQSPRHGTKIKYGEDVSDYRTELLLDIGKTQRMLEQYCGYIPETFTYPFGQISKESKAILKELGFTIFLTCSQQVNVLDGTEALFAVGRFNRPFGLSSEDYFKSIDID